MIKRLIVASPLTVFYGTMRENIGIKDTNLAVFDTRGSNRFQAFFISNTRKTFYTENSPILKIHLFEISHSLSYIALVSSSGIYIESRVRLLMEVDN